MKYKLCQLEKSSSIWRQNEAKVASKRFRGWDTTVKFPHRTIKCAKMIKDNTTFKLCWFYSWQKNDNASIFLKKPKRKHKKHALVLVSQTHFVPSRRHSELPQVQCSQNQFRCLTPQTCIVTRMVKQSEIKAVVDRSKWFSFLIRHWGKIYTTTNECSKLWKRYERSRCKSKPASFSSVTWAKLHHYFCFGPGNIGPSKATFSSVHCSISMLLYHTQQMK